MPITKCSKYTLKDQTKSNTFVCGLSDQENHEIKETKFAIVLNLE